MIAFWRRVTTALCEAVYPERCILCDTDALLSSPGALVSGLRAWDRSHCCQTCLTDLKSGGACHVQRGDLNVIAGVPTTGALVSLIGSWKYHGVRGLAWPLAELAEAVLNNEDRGSILIPVPLHRSRQRERGFNQARQLAELLALVHDLEVRNDILVRNRSTPQQAKLDSHAEARSLNVSKSFHSQPATAAGRSLVLVDDLVTSGATVLAAARSLREAGWSVNTVCAVGVSSA